MDQNIFFWGGKYKAGIIHNLIKKDQILADTSSLSVKYVFDPNLSEAQFECWSSIGYLGRMSLPEARAFGTRNTSLRG